MSRVALLSYRLGGTDGVSIEAAKWAGALAALGHDVRTIAGAGAADRRLPGLALDATEELTRSDLARALDDVDLVIVANVLSLPLNPHAGAVLTDLLRGRPTLLHHHDLASQRPHLAHLPPPPSDPAWRHVTINEYSRRELARHGITATTLYNHFDVAPPAGRRAPTRTRLRVEHERLVLFPSRAIARKNVSGAITLARALDATLWIVGPAEDGYGPILEAELARANVAVRRGLPDGITIHDAYAASDLVVVPSTWEGFGNPVLESVTHRRPLSVFPYPVLGEIEAHGFSFFHLDDVDALRRFIEQPDETLFDANLDVARRCFNLADLPARLAEVLAPFALDGGR